MATRWGLLRLQLHHIEYAMMHLEVAARRAVAVVVVAVAVSAAVHDVVDHDDQVNDDSQFLHSQVWRELARLS